MLSILVSLFEFLWKRSQFACIFLDLFRNFVFVRLGPDFAFLSCSLYHSLCAYMFVCQYVCVCSWHMHCVLVFFVVSVSFEMEINMSALVPDCSILRLQVGQHLPLRCHLP